jgi:glycine cleavage system aminomethyltransferase T/glycine/D-amino acid oxidase-like deaminating enzyme
MTADACRESAQIIIIGGGIIGLSTAYHLGRLGCRDVLLLEANQLTSGTSWHAAGIIGPLRSSSVLTRLSLYATELLPALEGETGQSTGYRRTGGLWLAQTPDRLIELRRIADLGQIAGLSTAILTSAQCAARLPLMHTADLLGAMWVEEDGQANPVDTCVAYAKAARARGVRIREHTRVTAIRRVGTRVQAVETAAGTSIGCEILVNCAGVWAREVGRLAAVPVPVQAVEHMYVVTEPIDGLPTPCPVVRDLDSGIYIKEDAGKIVLGGFEHNAKLWRVGEHGMDAPYLTFAEDWDQFEPFMQAGLRRIPALGRVGVRHFMNGPEGFTPDTRYLMGPVPGVDNLFIAAGFNSIGIASSAGAGRALADWIVGGEAPMDLFEVDIARMDPAMAADAFLRQRTPEAVANQFDMHWPYQQPRTARDLRRSPLHQALAACGAVFGAPAGWERPLWYALAPAERTAPCSYGAQSWWPYAQREADALMNGVGLLELSPFTKIELCGPDAIRLLQRVCAGDVAGPPGTLTYTQLLNRRGGIEADVTVTRLSEESFWLTSGAATRVKDGEWLRRARSDGERVTIRDVTAEYAVIGVMGPKARRLLSRVSSANLDDAAFPFAASREIEADGARVRASRVSYVGELGWELYVPATHAESLYVTLTAAGRELGLRHVGHWCVDGCRLEKAYRHWGHDIGADDTPLEAGLAFAVALEKPGVFIGRDALLAQRARGVSRHLILFSVEGEGVLLLHDEPLWCDGRLVGHTTSGGRGFRTGLTLAFAYVSCAPGTPRSELLAKTYEISIAGKRHRATALARAPYDPDGLRLRS